MQKAPRIFPMQTYDRRPSNERGQISEPVYMAAYEVYVHVYGPQEAMIDLEGRGCRGGFNSSEIMAFLYARSFPKVEWRQRVDEAFHNMEGIK
jgi:hypothetical protein